MFTFHHTFSVTGFCGFVLGLADTSLSGYKSLAGNLFPILAVNKIAKNIGITRSSPLRPRLYILRAAHDYKIIIF
jgi:hypothetical protein